MDQITSFGYWVRRQRKALDLTQAALAKQVGCATITIRKIERDERRPSPEMAELLVDYLAIGDLERVDFLDMARGRYVPEIETPSSPLDNSSVSATDEIAHNLPAQATAFIGRDDELAALDTLLLTPDVRLITIVGPGGMGKTRLALACAERFTGDEAESLFPDGIYFVPLAPLSDPDHIIPSMAEAFDFPLEAGGGHQRTAMQQILDYLREKKILILLDNFEHLLEGAELVSEILQTASMVKILATSRERLQMRTEQLFTIEGLKYPNWETPEDAAEYTAVKLFLQSARRVNHNFMLGQADLTFLTRICRLVGGLPLGVELAAAWVDMLSLEEIAAEIQRSLDFLETELRDMPERHSSMGAVLDTSWQRLSQAEQDAFAQFSVFRGGFDRAAGQNITGSSLRTLSGLINKSLLQYNQQTGRYQVHELLRQFGEKKLDQKKRLANPVRDRHSSYYCQRLQEWESMLKGDRQQKALAEIESDIDNIRNSWQWATQHSNIERLAMAMDSLGYFHEWRGRYQEGVVLFNAAATALVNKETATVLRTKAKLLAWQSVFDNLVNDDELAVALCQQALSLLRHEALAAIDTRWEKSFILSQLGRAGHDFGRRNQALKESLSLSRQLNDNWGLASTLQILGDTNSWSGNLTQMEDYLAEYLALPRASGDKLGTIRGLIARSEVTGAKGNFAQSLPHIQEALEISEEIGSLSNLIRCYQLLGMCYLHLHELDRADDALRNGLALSQELGDTFRVCFGHFGLYHVELARGNLTKAIRHAETIGQLTLPSWLWELGEIALIQENYDTAVTILQDNLPRALAVQQPMQTVTSYSYLSIAEHGRNRLKRARYYAYKGLEIATQSQIFMIMQLTYPSLINLLAEDRYLERAIELDFLYRSKTPGFDQGWVWDMLRRPFTKLVSTMPPETISEAGERGLQLDYWQTATQLLEELKKKGWDKELVSD